MIKVEVDLIHQILRIILQGLTIGEGAVIGAGATVLDDVAPDTTVVGTPARPLGAGQT